MRDSAPGSRGVDLKESPTRPIDRRALGPPHTCRANVDISDLQSHLQRASHLQPYSNGKQRV